MAESRVHVRYARRRYLGRIRLYKDDAGSWRVERCEEPAGYSHPIWQLYATRDHWQQAWSYAGWLSGKREA